MRGAKPIPADVARLLEGGAHARAIVASVDAMIAALGNPDPVVRVRAATLILKQSNKAREREIVRRLEAIESQLRERGLRP